MYLQILNEYYWIEFNHCLALRKYEIRNSVIVNDRDMFNFIYVRNRRDNAMILSDSLIRVWSLCKPCIWNKFSSQMASIEGLTYSWKHYLSILVVNVLLCWTIRKMWTLSWIIQQSLQPDSISNEIDSKYIKSVPSVWSLHLSSTVVLSLHSFLITWTVPRSYVISPWELIFLWLMLVLIIN